jgi:D-tyrosyl-tRNA(Tyr) deacylase
MRLLIQRVRSATVSIRNAESPFAEDEYSRISAGLLVFIGIHQNDTSESIPWLAKKLVELRIFEDDAHKMNLSALDTNAELLLVSQFTLYADCRRGRRPDFIDAAAPAVAERLYTEFINEVRKSGLPVATGIFGAEMQISLINDGPVTIILDSPCSVA